MKYDRYKEAARYLAQHVVSASKDMPLNQRRMLLQALVDSTKPELRDATMGEVEQILFHLMRADEAQRKLFIS